LNVYAASNGDDAVAVFTRTVATGALNFVEVEIDGVNSVGGITSASSVEVSPDGAHVYVSGVGADAVAVFSRGANGALTYSEHVSDGSTGALQFIQVLVDGASGVTGLNGVIDVTISPDGKHVYTAAVTSNAV
ncbi:beta-propeller fold lactonase family protein, partial [Bradyrhizobium sp. NBAIM08]|uniref:beta-propeller fold lactonase family protein n=1 Tax=Bradyrhizobium sp. NBAIM08 TaxID=2793815 RepID=UPI001CD2C312